METGSPGGSGPRSGEGESPSKVQDAPPPAPTRGRPGIAQTARPPGQRDGPRTAEGRAHRELRATPAAFLGQGPRLAGTSNQWRRRPSGGSAAAKGRRAWPCPPALARPRRSPAASGCLMGPPTRPRRASLALQGWRCGRRRGGPARCGRGRSGCSRTPRASPAASGHALPLAPLPSRPRQGGDGPPAMRRAKLRNRRGVCILGG